MIEYSPCSPSPTSFMEFEPSLLNRFKDKFSPSDWESLEKHLDDERKLSILKNALFGKLSRAQTRLEKESKMNVRDKCQLIGEMADYLYELQLVEHALKIPMLNIAKIIFSINPKRRVDKDSIQIKQKPIKKRKNELGGLVGEMSDELNKIPVREAKLLAASQVHRHHQEERFEEMDAIANDGPKRGRLKRRTIPTTGRSVKDLVAVVATNLLPTQSDNLRDMDDEQQKYAEFDKPEDGGETEAVNFLLMVAQIPSTLSDEGQQRGSTNSPQRTESAGNSAAELFKNKLYPKNY
uniref:Uncharacterized protein n=1 Tax=Globodera pallida TaxID=36090 RepID=A0A183CBC2_GLOPA